MPDRIQVHDLERSSEGYWQARVNIGGRSVRVNKRNGSWQTLPDPNGVFKDVPYVIAAELQRKVKALEKLHPGAGKESEVTTGGTDEDQLSVG